MSGGRARRAGRLLADAGLAVVATIGLVCAVAFVAGLLLRLSLVMFASGSMAPLIPTGSVAIVQAIPASQVRVGDIVTVDRGDQPPVTHRTVAVRGSGPTRVLRLRGDANAEPDAQSYRVSEVRIVRVWVPGLAPVIVWFRSPVVLGALTLAAASIVTWAFWPRRETGVPATAGAP